MNTEQEPYAPITTIAVLNGALLCCVDIDVWTSAVATTERIARMRYWPALSLSVVVALAPSVSGAQQAGPVAGATRPNLRVLKELPESQLFPLMNLVATSLGVRCDYCHVQESPDLTKTPANVGGWVWARDDKPQKRKALEMMQMVVDINATRFRGAHRVTCFTCHNGSTQPARTPPLPPPPDPAGARTRTPTPLPSVERVWTNYLNAVGEAGRPALGTGTIFSGWDDRSEGRYSRVEIVVTSDRYRLTLSNADGTPTATQGLDSAGAWVVANGNVQRLSAPSDVSRMQRIAARYRALKDRPPNLKTVGIEHVGGRDAYVTTARLDSITTWTAYFDVVTGLLRREMTTTETLLLPLQEQVDYDDYRDVSGVQLPFQVRTTTGAPYDLVTRTFLQIRHNIPIDEASLRPPSASR